MVDYPLLKYAAAVDVEPGKLQILYRGRSYTFPVQESRVVAAALRLADGRTHANKIIEETGVDSDVFRSVLKKLAEIPIVLDGKLVLREDGYLSGREMFWRLEELLFEWRLRRPASIYQTNFDRMIGTGKAGPEVVKGFCLELGYLLRQVPDELSLAVAHAPDEAVRSLFMEFYDEESKHGEILFQALKEWFPEEFLFRATPLPATVGLLNTYKAWATRDPLLYATALMRDESSRLDAEIPQEEDIYRGMRLYYEVPAAVVDKFEWHANLDRTCDHGFFPESVFSKYRAISQPRARLLVSALKQIIELHDLFKWNIASFYSAQGVSDRFAICERFESGFSGSYI